MFLDCQVNMQKFQIQAASAHPPLAASQPSAR